MMDSPSIVCTPPTVRSARKQYVDEEIIVWDDSPKYNHRSSSPFVTEVTDRHASNYTAPAVVDPEIDAIFIDKEGAETEQQQQPLKVLQDDILMEDKENMVTESVKATSQRPSTPEVHKHTMTPQSVFREQKAMMPPPSTTKRAKSSSPTKQRSPVNQTPQSTQRSRDVPPSAKTIIPSEDFSMIGDETNVDDTCFSTFSAVPDMTLFARLGEQNQQTPRAQSWQTATNSHMGPSSSPSPTPRKNASPIKDGNTTSLLIDFTQQFDSLSRNAPTPSQRTRLSPSRTEPNLLSYLNNQRGSPSRPSTTRQSLAASPTKQQSNLLNLLDFELPPPPTPRSTPAYSVREFESLKSTFSSQISGIKAKLSGKEAEVDALKRALEDAERRASEAADGRREEKIKREGAEQEKADWEKRGLEVERLLETVREEVLRSEEGREELERRFEEQGSRVAELESRNLDLQARLVSAPSAANSETGEGGGEVSGEQIRLLVQQQLDVKIEGVSRELHAVYKKKHETKVATLKKSYEAKAEKRCADLLARIEELGRVNEELSVARDATFSGEMAGEGMDKYRAEIEEQNARLAGLGQEMTTIRSEHGRLLAELEKERVEKGELVAAVDEMLSLQSGEGTSVIEEFKKSVRSSGLKPPGGGGGGQESRIGRTGVPGLPKAGSSKSKMMSNIERMGGTRGL